MTLSVLEGNFKHSILYLWHIVPLYLQRFLSFRVPRLVTKTEHRVYIHPKSVNANELFFPSPWFVYHLKLKTTQVCFHSILPVVVLKF